MKRCLLVATLASLAACSPEHPPAPADSSPALAPRPPLTKPHAPADASPATAPAPPSTTPPAPADGPAPKPTPPAPESGPAARPEPKAPVAPAGVSPGVHLPAWTFRTLDSKEIPVQLNGEILTTTPCPWSITASFKPENLDLGPEWPPAGARFVGKSRHPDVPASWAELYVIDSAERLARIGLLRKGECILLVKGMVAGCSIGGPVRLYVEGYRFTDYTPLVNPDGEEASRYARTLWFERISD